MIEYYVPYKNLVCDQNGCHHDDEWWGWCLVDWHIVMYIKNTTSDYLDLPNLFSNFEIHTDYLSKILSK